MSPWLPRSYGCMVYFNLTIEQFLARQPFWFGTVCKVKLCIRPWFNCFGICVCLRGKTMCVCITFLCLLACVHVLCVYVCMYVCACAPWDIGSTCKVYSHLVGLLFPQSKAGLLCVAHVWDTQEFLVHSRWEQEIPTTAFGRVGLLSRTLYSHVCADSSAPPPPEWSWLVDFLKLGWET